MKNKIAKCAAYALVLLNFEFQAVEALRMKRSSNSTKDAELQRAMEESLKTYQQETQATEDANLQRAKEESLLELAKQESLKTYQQEKITALRNQLTELLYNKSINDQEANSLNNMEKAINLKTMHDDIFDAHGQTSEAFIPKKQNARQTISQQSSNKDAVQQQQTTLPWRNDYSQLDSQNATSLFQHYYYQILTNFSFINFNGTSKQNLAKILCMNENAPTLNTIMDSTTDSCTCSYLTNMLRYAVEGASIKRSDIKNGSSSQPVPIPNGGNNCFINATMQMILSSKKALDVIFDDHITPLKCAFRSMLQKASVGNQRVPREAIEILLPDNQKESAPGDASAIASIFINALMSGNNSNSASYSLATAIIAEANSTAIQNAVEIITNVNSIQERFNEIITSNTLCLHGLIFISVRNAINLNTTTFPQCVQYHGHSLNLRAIVKRTGGSSTNPTHYVAYVDRAGKWYYCNDTCIRDKGGIQECLNECKASGDYILLYEKD